MHKEVTTDLKSDHAANTLADIRSENDKDFVERSKAVLEGLEYVRVEKLESYQIRKKLGSIGAAIVTPICGYIDYWLLMLQSGDDSFAGLTALVLWGIYYWATAPKRAYAKSYKQLILPEIAKLFGDLLYDMSGKINMASMTPSKIVPNHDRYKTEDYFSGTYKGINLEFSEIHLQERRRSNKRTRYVTVFKGLAILLNTKHKRFYGHTVLQKDQHAFFEWFKEKSNGLERAEMVDPEFEDFFDAYTNDQVEARYLIDPVMIERLKSLYEEYNGKNISAAFFENKMLILINSSHNHFEPANINIPATDPVSLLSMKKEVGQILSIIDKLALYDPKEVHKQAQN